MFKVWYALSLLLALFIFIQFINFGAFALAMYVFTVYNVPYWFSGTLVAMFWMWIGYFAYSNDILQGSLTG